MYIYICGEEKVRKFGIFSICIYIYKIPKHSAKANKYISPQLNGIGLVDDFFAGSH
jgi:hypothetical protein